jgi:hypothetical protein
MTDPTNARLRDFDIPVIMPRFDFIELPALAEEPVTTVTCASQPATTGAGTPLVTSTGVKPPVVKLGLPKASQRRGAVLGKTGLAFAVTSDKSVSDVEVRLVQLLANGKKRPLGAKLVIQPGHRTFTVTVLPTPYARAKLRTSGKTMVRAVAIVTALDGSVGQASADFTLAR